jgi:hypothetical protein
MMMMISKVYQTSMSDAYFRMPTRGLPLEVYTMGIVGRRVEAGGCMFSSSSLISK